MAIRTGKGWATGYGQGDLKIRERQGLFPRQLPIFFHQLCHAVGFGEAFDGEAVGCHYGSVVGLVGTAELRGGGYALNRETVESSELLFLCLVQDFGWKKANKGVIIWNTS